MRRLQQLRAGLSRERAHEPRLGEVDAMLEGGHRTPGESHGVMLLSPVDDLATVRLSEPVLNDTVTSTGRTWAWTLGQRYTQLDRLHAEACARAASTGIEEVISAREGLTINLDR